MKKSLSEVSVAQNKPKTLKKQSRTPRKWQCSAPEAGSEEGMKGFFNTLTFPRQ